MMEREIRASIVVDAPAERIWKLLSDPGRYPEFVEFVERTVELPDGEFGLDSTWKEYGGIRPFVGTSTWTVTVFEPVTRQVHAGSDVAMNFELTLELTPTDGGTRIDVRQTMAPKWFAMPVSLVAWPLTLRKKADAMMQTTLGNVKALVQAPQ